VGSTALQRGTATTGSTAAARTPKVSAQRREGSVDHVFWGTISLSLLGVLLGLLTIMVVEDLRGLAERHMLAAGKRSP
jgi:hypothetical protein